MRGRSHRTTLTLAGAAALFGAAVSGEIAWLHMRWMAQTYGTICGAEGVPHCAACPSAIGLLALGLSLLAVAAGASRAPARAKPPSRG